MQEHYSPEPAANWLTMMAVGAALADSSLRGRLECIQYTKAQSTERGLAKAVCDGNGVDVWTRLKQFGCVEQTSAIEAVFQALDNAAQHSELTKLANTLQSSLAANNQDILLATMKEIADHISKEGK